MSSSRASKKAPFWKISTAFPGIGMPSAMPARDGISSSSGRSLSRCSRCGSLWRLMDQMARPSTATATSKTAMVQVTRGLGAGLEDGLGGREPATRGRSPPRGARAGVLEPCQPLEVLAHEPYLEMARNERHPHVAQDGQRLEETRGVVF